MNRFALIALLIAASPLVADEKELSVEELAERGRKSLAVITQAGRDGRRHGIGTGFVVAADGLIATNLHVIGEGRAISVELPDGSKHEVTAVHATDRSGDLALIRIKAKGLTSLELGDSDKLKDGQSVVALGNPQGLRYSVVGGVVSGQRVMDGRKMIQLAIPLEPGNSGGPLLDRFGKVQGILTLKSAVTQNLGFAVPVNALKPLLKKPNPIAMERWLALGVPDPDEWTTLMGARWRQRAGRIQVDGAGSGFGGRALLLARKKPPELPYELAVSVKLDDERGAAGLIFHADGGDKHYGFYPSGGEFRLTRFDGPDVYSWKILAQKPSPAYRSGEWNTIKVRVEKGKIKCYVNDELLVESTDDEYTSGQVGLAKFRDTVAEFKGFAVARTVGGLPAGTAERVRKALDGLPAGKPIPDSVVEALAPDAASGAALRDRARSLEQEAARLRKLADAVYQKRVRSELAKLFAEPEEKVDLAHAALLVAKLDNDELDVAAYRGEIERLAKKLAASIPDKADEKAKLTTLNKFFFAERGYHGSRADYYSRSNSYLNEVIDDREGIPITLSVLYIELARRVGLKVEGVGLPGHFVVRHVPAKGEPQLIDVYDGGKPLGRAEAAEKVKNTAGIDLTDDLLKPVGKRAIVVRMLHNLLNLTRDERDLEGALRYLDAIVAVAPDSGRERWMRAVLNFQTGRRPAARADVEWLLEKSPDGVDLDDVRGLQRALERDNPSPSPPRSGEGR